MQKLITEVPTIGGVKMKKLGKNPGSYKKLVQKHLGKSPDKKITKSDGDKIIGIADGNGDISRNLNLLVDKSKSFMGKRATRFAMVVDDTLIQNTFIEEPGEYKVSSAEHLLTVV